MSVSRRAQTGRNKYVCCMHVVIATTRFLQPMDTVCRFSGLCTPSVRSSFKMRAFCACFRSSIRWRESSVWCFDDLKRLNGITRGGDFIVNEMAWQYYICTNNKTKRKVISHAFLLGWTQSKALYAVTNSYERWAHITSLIQVFCKLTLTGS